MNSQLNSLVMRPAERADAVALYRLAQLDSKTAPAGDALVADVDGEIVAALPLNGGPAIADPFRRTADIVRLLQLRAAQIR